MTQTMTRSKVQNIPMPDLSDADLEQTEAQSPGYMKVSVKSSMGRQPRNRCQTCLKHESGKRARKLHRGKPADSEVQSQVNKDGRIQQKDDASLEKNAL